jgi:hypothetical protein
MSVCKKKALKSDGELVHVCRYNLFNRKWNHIALSPRGCLSKDFGENIEYNDSDIDNMCKNYINMINWYHHYYNLEDISWECFYPYHYVPLFKNVAIYLQKMSNGVDNIDITHQCSYNMIHQLLAILPRKGLGLVPKNMQDMCTKNGVISDLYPTNALIEDNVVLIPFANMKRIVSSIGDVDVGYWVEYNDPVIYKFKHHGSIQYSKK